MDLLPVVLAALGSQVLNSWVTATVVRGKSSAEIHKLRAEVQKLHADTDATTSAAWRELLQPFRDQTAAMRTEMLEMRGEMVTLARENSELRTELKTAKQELGKLSRLEREASAKSIEETTALKVTLAGHGIDIPTTGNIPVPLARTRQDDP